MAKTQSVERQQKLIDTALLDAKAKVQMATITCASQASGDLIEIAKLKKGERFLFGMITVSATLSTATIAVGNDDDDDKYKVAATHTTANAPAIFGMTAAQDNLSADETIYAKVGTAALPSSGTIKIALFYASNE